MCAPRDSAWIPHSARAHLRRLQLACLVCGMQLRGRRVERLPERRVQREKGADAAGAAVQDLQPAAGAAL